MASRRRNLKYGGQSDAIIWPKDHPRETKSSRSRKNTRRWCRGKVGVEHASIINKRLTGPQHACRVGESWRRQLFGNRWICYHEELCSSCGKVLRHFLPAEECPDHVGPRDVFGDCP